MPPCTSSTQGPRHELRAAFGGIATHRGDALAVRRNACARPRGVSFAFHTRMTTKRKRNAFLAERGFGKGAA
jgi:hypothetical protein